MSRLEEERLKRNLSQARIAQIADVAVSTVSRWEHGILQPHGESREKLCSFFGMSALDLGFGRNPVTASPLLRQFDNDPIAQLIALPFSGIALDSLPHEVQILSEKAMSMQSRRDLLKGTLAALIFGPIHAVNTENDDDLLVRCDVGIVACQQLSRSNIGDDLALAFHGVSTYLAIADSIAHRSSQCRARALGVAARCAILKVSLGWHCAGLATTIQYGQDAVAYTAEYGKQIGDPSLHLSALSKLAWSYYYFYGKRSRLALETSECAMAILEQSDTEIHASIRGQTYCNLALMQANLEMNADTALGQMTEKDPGHESVAFLDFTLSDIPRELGLIYTLQDKPREARNELEKLIDPKTLALKEYRQSERGRLEIVNTLTTAALNSPDRDMDEVIHLWVAGVEGAKKLRSERRFSESIEIHSTMKAVWPGERKIKDLREHLVHWQSA